MNEDDRVELVVGEINRILDRYPFIRVSAGLRVELAYAAIASLQGADTVTEAMIEAVYDALPKYGLDQDLAYYSLTAIRTIVRAYEKLRTAAPTAQDDNGVRIEAQDDAEWLRVVAQEVLDGTIIGVGGAHDVFAERLEGIASRLSADHTGVLVEALSGGTLSVTSFDGHALRIDFETRSEALQMIELLSDLAARGEQSPDVPRHE